MRVVTTRALIALSGLTLTLILQGCPTNNDCGGFGCGGDDDDTDGEFECPGTWWGFGVAPEDWMVVGVSARAAEDFQIGPRDFTQYEILPAEWNAEFNHIEVFDRPGGCFQDFGGMFLGDGDVYPANLYSVAFSLVSEGDWTGGSIQVIPTDGDDPYPIGEPSSIRGTAIEPDGEGGFVVCGGLEAEGDNSVIWVDFDGTILAKDDLPSGSCYDLYLAGDGTYYVTDVVEHMVYRYDLDLGEFQAVGELPTDGPQGTGDWVVAEASDGTLFLGDDSELYNMDPVTGETSLYTNFTTVGTNGAHAIRLNWSDQLNQITASKILRDLKSSGYQGPHTGGLAKGNGPSIHPSMLLGYGIAMEELIIDYSLVDLQEFIDNPAREED